MNDDLLNALRYKSEGTDIDFKSEQYRFVGGSEYEKAELLKDILAIANAWRDGTGYILLGFQDRAPHPAEVVGISSHIDDASLQQFVNGKVKPKLTFHYEERLFEEKTIGVISIPKQTRPFFLANDYGRLRKNIAYVRRGSSTDEAEPTEIAGMVAAESNRGRISLELIPLTRSNLPIPDTASLRFFQVSEDLPDYASEPPSFGPYGLSVPSALWQHNKDFWREYGEFIRISAALFELKFVLKNRSETQLSNAKLEVFVEVLDGQTCQLLAGVDVPEEPSTDWSPVIARVPQGDASLAVDERGTTPVCHIRFGTLLPSEEGHSDSVAVIPNGPGNIRLRFRVLASELPAPYEVEKTIQATGESFRLDFEALDDLYGKALLERHQSDQ